jgi:nitrite reductase/ring-hydroxylating ferredoxin subunit
MSKAKVPEGNICEFGANRKSLAVANVKGKPCVVSNICTHVQRSLARGVPEGMVATCPWHDWKLKTYPAEVRGEDILVDLN